MKANTSLTSIDFSRNDIGAEGAKAIAEALTINTSLTNIDFSSNNIGPEGAKAIAEALKSNTSLTSIDFSSNNIGPEGAKALSDALKINTSLTSIDFGSNRIGDEGAKALADALKINTSLTSIDFGSNRIGDEGAKALADALKINTSLTSIDFGSNRIGDEGAKALAHALKINTSLASIDLSGSNISNESAKAIAEALISNTSLTSIDLSGNNIGDEGAKAITEALISNTSLTSINLYNNNIGDEGAKAIADALKTNTSLTHIILDRHSLGAEGKKAAAEIDSHIARNKAIDDCLSPLKDFTENPDITLIDASIISDSLKKLTELVPSLGNEDSDPLDNSPVAEAYRLLTALEHIANHTFSESIEAFQCLLPAITTPQLQESAEALLFGAAHELYTGLTDVKLLPFETQAVLRLVLYGLKNHLNKPEATVIIADTLLCLQDKDLKSSFEQVTKFKDEVALVNNNDIFSIARIALAQINAEVENSNPHERILLATLLKTGDYHQDALPLLFQSPAFLTNFKEKYSQNRYFLVEDYFATTELISDNESNLLTIKNSPTEASAVTETQVKECKLMTTALPIKTPVIPLTLLNHDDSSQDVDNQERKIMINSDSQDNEYTNEPQKETMKVIDANVCP